MLHAGLDLSRKKVDVCLLSERGRAPRPARRPARHRLAEDPRPPDRGGPPEPVCAVIESMTGARLVHDTLEQQGWEVEIADAQKVKGLAPLACKTDKIDSLVLATLSPARPGAGDLASRSEGPRGARARPLSPPPGQAPLGAQEPDPLDPDQLRPPLPGLRPVRGRGPKAARPPRRPRALARQRHRGGRADRRPRAIRSIRSTAGSRTATPTTPTSRS